MQTRVIVVGAGPTGLLLAGDLAAAGTEVVLLEKRSAALSNLSRAFAVHARSLELLDARGLADDLVRTGRTVRDLRLFDRLRLNLDDLPGRFPFVLVTPQYEVERLLRRRLDELGVHVRHDTEVTGITQDADAVTVRATTPEGATTFRADHLVGTDGVRSTVRQAVGVEFPGETVIRSMVISDVRLARPPSDTLTVSARDDALGFLVPFGDGWHRFIGWSGERDPDEPVDLDEIRDLARATLGDDHGMHEVRYASRFAADERQATTYRAGRVFLAGDAAHAHSPAGGLGMNTGLQDAANLAWKLAAVHHGADESLLDSYVTERYPVGRQVLRASGTILRLATRPGRAVAWARRLLTAVVSHVTPVRRRAVLMISAIGVAYPPPAGAHRSVGRRVPDLPLVPGEHGDRLAEALRGGRFVLARPPSAAAGPAVTSSDPPAVAGEVSTADRVVVRRADQHRSTLLVRPDGYLAAVVPG